MDILNNLNLCGNQIQNLVLHPSATVPTAKAGAIYFDTSTGVNAVKVYDSSASLWRALLDGRDGCVTNSMISSLATGLQVGGVDVFVASGNDARAHIPTTGAVYDFVTDAFKKNDAMVYMGTFAAQATSGVTLTKSMFTLTGGGNPDNLTTWMSKGYTFKVTGTGYFGTKKVEPGDVVIVGLDSPGTTESNYDLIQMNLTDYITTFGGATGAITLTGVGGVAATAVVGGVNFSISNGLLSATVVRDTPTVSWGGGSQYGPTLTVKAMGNISTPVAIPVASDTDSGVVTTTEQLFNGRKIFKSDVVLKRTFSGVNNVNNKESTLSIQASNMGIKTVNGVTTSVTAWHLFSTGYREGSSGDESTIYPLQIAGLYGNSDGNGLFYTGHNNYSGADNSFFWGIATRNPKYLLHVNGSFGAGESTFSGRIKFAHSSNNIDLPYFEIVNIGTNASPVYAIHTNVGFYSDSFITSGGLGQSGGASGGSGMEHVYKYSDLTGSNVFDIDSDDDTFNAYAIKQMWLTASGALSNAITTLNPSGSGDVVTSVTKSGNAITVTKGDVGFIGTSSSINNVLGSSNVNNQLVKGSGFSLYMTSTGTTNTPSGYTTGLVLQAERYVGATSGTLASSFQLFVPYNANKFYIRNSFSSSTGAAISEWQDWSELITDKNLNSKISSGIIHTYTVKRSLASGNGSWTATSGTSAYMEYNSPDVFSSKNIVAALYDSSDCQVMTDVSIVAKTTSSGGSTITTYFVRLNFASAIGSSDTYRLVIFGF